MTVLGDEMARGKVYLVGAGPGDPGLFTLKGRQVLQDAEVVIYDHLANPSLLDYAPADAEKIYVGKKGGDHTLTQEAINELLVEKGKDCVVVRLKGGDPFVFGRGGEEAQELARAGVPFEVVPGVTAATAVPAYAGIPLSHRDWTASMAFVTGHERADQESSKIDWSKISTGVGTLVFFMGMKNLSLICRNLMDNGRDPETPVAVVRWGTTPDQKTIVGTLVSIADKVSAAGLQPPALIIVGDVVRLRDELCWFEKRPLFGTRIVVTRARNQASTFKARLESLGAHCIEFPTIKIVPPSSWEPLDRAVQNLAGYDWLLFTSVNGVRFFMERLFHWGSDARALADLRVAAIGPATAAALEGFGIRSDVMPHQYRAEAILDALGSEKVARDVLPEELRRQGARVDVIPAYETVFPSHGKGAVVELLHRGNVDCITFTSSSTVKNFVKALGIDPSAPPFNSVTIACIGPVTADTARSLGLVPRIVAEEYTIDGLVRALCLHFSAMKQDSL